MTNHFVHGDGRSRLESDDENILMYHEVHAHEGFDVSAQILFQLVRKAQELQPGRKRRLFLDIRGHRNSKDGFDSEMQELQIQFLLGFLLPYLSEVQCPLSHVANRHPQNNDIPLAMGILDANENSEE